VTVAGSVSVPVKVQLLVQSVDTENAVSNKVPLARVPTRLFPALASEPTFTSVKMPESPSIVPPEIRFPFASIYPSTVIPSLLGM